jgi:hypothetical protein
MAQSPAKEQAGRGRLPVVRRDRRPALAALAVLLILLGALGSALVAFRSGDRTSVLVAARDIPIGQVITADDFTRTSVAGEGRYLVPADAEGSFVGSRSSVGVPAGTLVNRQMFTVAKQVPEGAQLVGVVLDTNQRPSEVPKSGDVVRLYYVTGASDQGGTNSVLSGGDQVVESARVVSVGSGRGADSRNVTVLVRDAAAGDVAEFASSGNLAMAILPSDTRPAVDLESVG